MEDFGKLSKWEEFNVLLERSRRFCETARMQIEKSFYDLAAFSLEQCVQLYLKAALLKLGVDYPRTHSIRRLLEILHELTGEGRVIDLVSKYSVELALLEDTYITSRYVGREFKPDEVTRLRRVVEEVIEVVRESID